MKLRIAPSRSVRIVLEFNGNSFESKLGVLFMQGVVALISSSSWLS
uniref:Uncharacterized protein n=1 Tax=Trichinella nativa TaxID=6335 RepID=A0A0V1KI80_9BILA